MTEHPISFSAEMIRAILDGRKSQTRRVIKPQPGWDAEAVKTTRIGDTPLVWPMTKDEMQCGHPIFIDGQKDCAFGIRNPYGKVGDRLWVKETWADTNGESGPMLSYKAGGDRFLTDESYPVDYSRYPNCHFAMWCGDLRRGEEGHSWRNSRFMPRWASRLTLETTGVRVERLHAIRNNDEDLDAEGIDAFWEGPNEGGVFHVGKRWTDFPDVAFSWLWDSINGKKAPWESNPWVWVVEFRRVV